MTAPTRSTSPASAGPGSGDALRGYGALLRFNLRRDRIRLPLWILGLTLGVASTAVSFPGLYPTAEERLAALMTVSNPGTTALIGPPYGGAEYTYGIMTGHQTLVLAAVVAALMSIFTLVRHTRAEEESGRAELVRSSIVGRHASAAAAITLVLGANLLLALLLTVSLAASGVESITWAGSFVFALAVAAVGVVFTAVAAITVQLTEHSRTATSTAGLVLAVAYVLRAVGDVGSDWLSWLSPIGWSQATESYATNNLAPLGISLGVAIVLIAIAVPLSRRRDVGAGMFGTRPGPARAGALLGGPLGLTLHLQRTNIIGWIVAMFTFGIVYGPVLSDADSFLEDLEVMGEFLPDIGGASGSELFGATILAVFAIICSIPAIQVLLRLRTEELAGRAGPLLATPLSRWRWSASALLVAILTGALVLLAMGLGTGLGAGWAMADWSWVSMAVVAAVSYLPAVAVIMGVGMALFGLLPRLTTLVWAPVAFAAVVMYFGGLLNFPDWLINLSPFSHIPQQPAADFEAAPLVWLSLVALALIGLGLIGLRRRDIQDT